MAHEHEVIDRDMHFIIDPDTMEISCAGTVKALKRGDHKSERYTFEMPRCIEGHDMSLCNKVEVHYNNVKYDPATRETTTNKSFDEVQGFGISEADENTVVWTWLVQGDATQLDGTLNFCIRFACMNGEEIEYQKFSGNYEGIAVGESIWNTEEVAKACADVLEQWRQELVESGGVSDDRIEEAVAAYLAENPVEVPESSGGGLNSTASALLIEILQSAVYSTNVSGKIESLKEALASGGSSDGGSGDNTGGGSGTEAPDEPDVPTVTDDITVTDGIMTIVSVTSAITVSDGVMTIA